MLLARLVVKRHAPLHRRHQRREIERLDQFQSRHFLRQIEQIAAIAIGHGAHAGARIGRKLERLAIMGLDALQQFLQRRVVQPAQH
jgi:hypothetical protein